MKVECITIRLTLVYDNIVFMCIEDLEIYEKVNMKQHTAVVLFE